MNFPLETALVTGAARGIGAATAQALAREGYYVVLTDRIDEEGKDQTGQIHANGGGAEYCTLDVTDSSAVNDLIAEYESRFGAFSIIVNNAGFVRERPLADLSDRDWDEAALWIAVETNSRQLNNRTPLLHLEFSEISWQCRYQIKLRDNGEKECR